jgi:branched-chain amino acid transport system ATP-binding protein
MLSIARALLLNPKFLILDEPSQGLAPVIVQEVMRTVGKMKEEGIAVLLVEQNVFLALQLADRAYVLSDGEIVFDGTAADLDSDRERMESLAGISHA